MLLLHILTWASIQSAVIYISYKLDLRNKHFFDEFQAFFVVFNHANSCASMRLLVEIHNT